MKKVYLTLTFILVFAVSVIACGYCSNSYSNCLSSASWKHFIGMYNDVEFIVANNNCMNTYFTCCSTVPFGKN